MRVVWENKKRLNCCAQASMSCFECQTRTDNGQWDGVDVCGTADDGDGGDPDGGDQGGNQGGAWGWGGQGAIQ